MKRSELAIALLLTLSLSGCGSYRAYEQGTEAERLKNYDEAVTSYAKALEVDPDNMKYKIALQRARLIASQIHFERGKALRTAGQNDLAAVELELTVKLDPTNQFAAVEMAKAVQAVQEASRAGDKAYEQMKKRAVSKTQPPQLNPASNEPISLTFPRETPVKDIYRALGNAFGINILFDQAVKDDRITIELRDVTAQQALERVMQAAGNFYKVLDEKTIIIVPDTPQARRDYEDLVIQTFYLSNGDAEQVTNVVRTMIEARNVFPLKALNAITIRDTADKVRIAEKIIEANDKAKAEVVVDVELLQLDVTKTRALGAQLTSGPGSLAGGSVNLIDAAGKPITSLGADAIRNLATNQLSFSIPSLAYDFVKTNVNAQLLAKPQLRISEGEKATLHIGSKVPVPTATLNTSNAIGGTILPVTTFQYQDIGIKISLEPRVHHNREVTLKLTVEVSNIAGKVQAGTGSPDQPIIGTRTIESTIRLKDGETNFLAGLIRKDDSTTTNTFPFLGDIPILGRLFNHDSRDQLNTDLVLTMTPHIVRIADITEDDLAPMWVGTQNNLTFRGVSPRLESNVGSDPFTSGAYPRISPEGDEEATPQQPTTPQQVKPGVDLAPNAPPSDPFRDFPPPTTNPPVSEEKRKVDTGTTTAAAVAEPEAAIAFSPRVAVQPSTISMKPGEERIWSIVGMDVDGLTTDEIKIHFDPSRTDVTDLQLGTAFFVDPKTPPAITIDRDKGLIRIVSSDGTNLRFLAGGDILAMRVRAGATGEGDVILEPFVLHRKNGDVVAANISGGRANVQ